MELPIDLRIILTITYIGVSQSDFVPKTSIDLVE